MARKTGAWSGKFTFIHFYSTLVPLLICLLYEFVVLSCGGETNEISDENGESLPNQTMAWFTETQVLSALSARSREAEAEGPADSNDFSIGETILQ